MEGIVFHLLLEMQRDIKSIKETVEEIEKNQKQMHKILQLQPN